MQWHVFRVRQIYYYSIKVYKKSLNFYINDLLQKMYTTLNVNMKQYSTLIEVN
jgi:hypothetical protein